MTITLRSASSLSLLPFLFASFWSLGFLFSLPAFDARTRKYHLHIQYASLAPFLYTWKAFTFFIRTLLSYFYSCATSIDVLVYFSLCFAFFPHFLIKIYICFFIIYLCFLSAIQCNVLPATRSTFPVKTLWFLVDIKLHFHAATFVFKATPTCCTNCILFYCIYLISSK